MRINHKNLQENPLWINYKSQENKNFPLFMQTGGQTDRKNMSFRVVFATKKQLKIIRRIVLETAFCGCYA